MRRVPVRGNQAPSECPPALQANGAPPVAGPGIRLVRGLPREAHREREGRSVVAGVACRQAGISAPPTECHWHSVSSAACHFRSGGPRGSWLQIPPCQIELWGPHEAGAERAEASEYGFVGKSKSRAARRNAGSACVSRGGACFCVVAGVGFEPTTSRLWAWRPAIGLPRVSIDTRQAGGEPHPLAVSSVQAPETYVNPLSPRAHAPDILRAICRDRTRAGLDRSF